MKFFISGLIALWLFAEATAAPITTAFTYQGELQAADQAANGPFDFEFELYDQASGGLPLALLPLDDVQVIDGVFTVQLDFGVGTFVGDMLWLEISVRDGPSTGGYVGLLPRQEITATPYALHAERVAMNAVGSSEIDTSQVQQRINGNCSAGSFVQRVNQNGTVDCADSLSEVTSAEIVNGTIASVDLGDSSVTPEKLDANESYTVDGLTSTGPTEISGALSITSLFDIDILDNLNAVRWFDSTGAEEYASITVASNRIEFFDNNENRRIFLSNSSGIGIDTQAIDSDSAVTIPSLTVLNDLEVGLIRVQQSYPLSSRINSCATYGGDECFVGSLTVSCPVGSRVVGGGLNAAAGQFGSIGRNFPNSDTSWSCSSAHDVVGFSDVCFAMCARLQ